MDDYKWAGWQSDHPLPVDVPVATEQSLETETSVTAQESSSSASVSSSSNASSEKEESISSSTESSSKGKGEVASIVSTPTIPASSTSHEAHVNQAPPIVKDGDPSPVVTDTLDAIVQDSSTVPSEIPSTSAPSSSPAVTAPPSGSTVIIVSSSGTIAEVSTAILVDATTKKTVSASPASATHSSTALIASGGESIYRTIMKKLQMLEGNITLGVSYMEEQMQSVRDVVRRLEEDVGRLDALVSIHTPSLRLLSHFHAIGTTPTKDCGAHYPANGPAAKRDQSATDKSDDGRADLDP